MDNVQILGLIAVLTGMVVISWLGGYYWAVDSRPEGSKTGEIHDKKVKAALEAIETVFSDTSVPQGETKASLNSLVGEIEGMTETLVDEESQDEEAGTF